MSISDLSALSRYLQGAGAIKWNPHRADPCEPSRLPAQVTGKGAAWSSWKKSKAEVECGSLGGPYFSIEEVKIYKPNSKVYDIPINKYKIKKNEVAFLSANTWDVSGGGNYGFNSIWVNRNNNIFDNLDYLPKHEIKDLHKLLDLI